MIPELLIIDNSIVFIAISVLGALCYSYSRVQKWNPASTAPLSTPLSGRDGVFAKFKYFSEAKSWLWDGVQKYPGRLFRLRTPDGYLHVAAHEQLPELNRLGEDQLRVAFTDKVSPKLSAGQRPRALTIADDVPVYQNGGISSWPFRTQRRPHPESR